MSYNLIIGLLHVPRRDRLSKDVKITADSDDNLVSAYNKANDTEYNILPAENYSFTNKTVTIENGESVSGDSIKIELLNVGSLTTEGGFVASYHIFYRR